MLVTVKGAGSWCKKAWLPTCKLPDSRQLSIGGGEKELESRLCQDLTTTAQVSHLRTHLLISNNTVLPDLWGGAGGNAYRRGPETHTYFTLLPDTSGGI